VFEGEREREREQDGAHLKLYFLVLLSTEGTSFSQPSSPSSGLTKYCGTTSTNNNCLGMTEHCSNLITAGTLDIHKIRIWMLHQSFQLVLPPRLMGLGVQQILILWMSSVPAVIRLLQCSVMPRQLLFVLVVPQYFVSPLEGELG
jgi:hypothetical protein